jgi:hypothetical protein
MASARRLLGALTVVLASFALAAAPAIADSVQISTAPSLYPSFDPTVLDYVVRCTSNTPVQVVVSAPAGQTVDVDRHGSQSGNFATSVGLNPGQRFTIVVNDGTTTSTYSVRCLPSDFPTWTYQRTGTPQTEWYLVQPFARTDFMAVPPGVDPTYGMIFDASGVPVWWYKSGKTTLDFRLFPDGNVGFAHFDATAEERRLDGSLARTITLPQGVVLDPHELMQLPNGNYLFSTNRGLPGQSACGLSNILIGDNGFEEMAPDGTVVKTWWASDHIPTSEVPSAWCGQIVAQPVNGNIYDVYHINSVEPDGSGFVISFRHLDAVYRVDSTGAVSWKVGGVARPESLTVQGDSFPAGDTFRGQHDARILSDGSLTVHDNGYHPGTGTTRPPRGVRFAIDTGSRTATLIDQKSDPGTVATPLCCGSARKLPGGDWLLNWGSSGLTTELDSSGNRVSSLTFDQNNGAYKLFSYRANEVLPGLLSRDALRAGMDLQFPRGYPRARGTGPLRVPLVPAFRECTAPDLTHGAPLSYGACSSPSTASLLTVGTPDANGVQANSIGSVSYRAIGSGPSTQPDVSVVVSIADVRRAGDLSDYTGELQLRGSLRITDRLNGVAGDEAGTVQDTELPAAIPCAATESASIGASCHLSTTVNSLTPGAVVGGKRAIWQFGAVQIYDGGTSGTAGAPDAQLFESQGLFVP